MRASNNLLTYVFENGDEKTISLESDILCDFVKWFKDAGSNNQYELIADIGEKITLFKNTLFYVKY
jgi:hypothetical protein